MRSAELICHENTLGNYFRKEIKGVGEAALIGSSKPPLRSQEPRGSKLTGHSTVVWPVGSADSLSHPV